MPNCSLRRRLILLAVPFLCGVMAWSGHAQSNARGNGATHGQRSVKAARTELPVTVDGSLEEPAWEQAPISLGVIQKDPQEGQPSTEKTEFRILYTASTLYIGVICYDSSPQEIRANERRRDSKLENDDTVTIVLDTFHDHRNAYMFRTNPLGAQYDALITDEGNNLNENWDEKWDVASRLTPAGWTTEFAIPFKSLRVMEENGHSWGLDLERVIRRKNEFAYWNSFRRGFQLQNVSQAGHLEGLENIQTGLRLRVKPYLLGGFSQSVKRVTPTSQPFDSTLRNASDVGMEVVKYRITPSLTADLTWNTDFAQTEVDDQQVNLDRFPLFFPEKREFFQEGAGIYEFGISRGEGTEPVFKLFHSRQIGLVRGRPVPILGGGRITGKLQGLTLGLLNVQTEALPSEGVPASNYGVLRVKRDVLSRSTIGGFFLSREKSGSRDFNRVYGVDANLVFFRYLTIGGLLGKSSSPGVKGDNWVSAGGILWDSDLLDVGSSWAVVDRDFRDDLGYIPRKNIRRLMPRFAIQPRPKSRWIRQVVFRFHSDYIMTQENELETRINHYTAEARFHSGDVASWAPHTRLERLRVPFLLRKGVVIPAGTYSWWYSSIRYRSNPARKLSTFVSWNQHYGFFGGSLDNVVLQPGLRLSEQLSVEAAYELNKASFRPGKYTDERGRFPDREGKFTDHVINTRINYNFTNQWLTSTTIQYNSTDSFLGFNFRLNYIFRPGDDFFLIYNEGRRVGGLLDGEKDRTLQAKLTYSFDF